MNMWNESVHILYRKYAERICLYTENMRNEVNLVRKAQKFEYFSKFETKSKIF